MVKKEVTLGRGVMIKKGGIQKYLDKTYINHLADRNQIAPILCQS